MVAVTALLHLLPALALIALMALRRYPGERTLVRLAATERRPRATSAITAARCTGSRKRVPRGSLLIACALAVRPPPSSAVVIR